MKDVCQLPCQPVIARRLGALGLIEELLGQLRAGRLADPCAAEAAHQQLHRIDPLEVQVRANEQGALGLALLTERLHHLRDHLARSAHVGFRLLSRDGQHIRPRHVFPCPAGEQRDKEEEARSIREEACSFSCVLEIRRERALVLRDRLLCLSAQEPEPRCPELGLNRVPPCQGSRCLVETPAQQELLEKEVMFAVAELRLGQRLEHLQRAVRGQELASARVEHAHQDFPQERSREASDPGIVEGTANPGEDGAAEASAQRHRFLEVSAIELDAQLTHELFPARSASNRSDLADDAGHRREPLSLGGRRRRGVAEVRCDLEMAVLAQSPLLYQRRQRRSDLIVTDGAAAGAATHLSERPSEVRPGGGAEDGDQLHRLAVLRGKRADPGEPGARWRIESRSSVGAGSGSVLGRGVVRGHGAVVPITRRYRGGPSTRHEEQLAASP